MFGGTGRAFRPWPILLAAAIAVPAISWWNTSDSEPSPGTDAAVVANAEGTSEFTPVPTEKPPDTPGAASAPVSTPPANPPASPTADEISPAPTVRGFIPPPATGLTATAGDSQARLCWNPAPGATGYVLYYRDITAGTRWVRLPYPAEGTCSTIKLLVNGHREEFRIRSSNGNGEADYSNTATTTLPVAIPPPATGLTATAGDAQARLCWNPAPGATGYVVYYRDTTAGTQWVRLPYPATGTCDTVKLLVNGHGYAFRVRSSNGNGEADYSNTATTTLRAAIPPPATGLTATAGDAQAHLCWNAAPGATGYVVYYRDTTAGTPWVRLPYPAEGTCNTVKLLVNGHSDEFRVRSSNGSGEADYSNTATAVPGS
ncbi:hypothetical protein [Frankia tisae]|uniref:hypothetical protein n=1 Tax=Frankia tisae TaxID=2950104 RepID=UPI0021C01304|nr:hypothetical protein [Frankia tisae]